MEIDNFVGTLQEKCGKMKHPLPNYKEVETDSNKLFKFICTLGELTAEGIGISKKTAKQNAAKLMISKLETEKVSLEKFNVPTPIKSSISKLFEYSVKENISKPLFSEKSEENGQIVVECNFNSYIGVGKGSSRKIAKEMSADQVLKHFNIYSYFQNLNQTIKRLDNLKNAVSQLNELCQLKKLKNAIYNEKQISLPGNKTLYEVTCVCGDINTKSSENISKRDAKIEAASLMLNILGNNTPASSPKQLIELNEKEEDKETDEEDKETDEEDKETDEEDKETYEEDIETYKEDIETYEEDNETYEEDKATDEEEKGLEDEEIAPLTKRKKLRIE